MDGKLYYYKDFELIRTEKVLDSKIIATKDRLLVSRIKNRIMLDIETLPAPYWGLLVMKNGELIPYALGILHDPRELDASPGSGPEPIIFYGEDCIDEFLDYILKSRTPLGSAMIRIATSLYII